MHRSQLAGPMIDHRAQVPGIESDAIVAGLKWLPALAAGRNAGLGHRGAIGEPGEGRTCAVPAIHSDRAVRANSWT